MANVSKANLAEKFKLIDKFWSPRIAAAVGDMYVKLAKLQGEFMWHRHENEDELFLVVAGRLTLKVEDQEDIVLEEGELVVIPHGVRHMPAAPEPVHVMLFEPASTVNTGELKNERTVEKEEWV